MLRGCGLWLCGGAGECLAALSARLGTSSYFFGGRPSALDATAYGYLEAIRRTPSNGGLLRSERTAQHPSSTTSRS